MGGDAHRGGDLESHMGDGRAAYAVIALDFKPLLDCKRGTAFYTGTCGTLGLPPNAILRRTASNQGLYFNRCKYVCYRLVSEVDTS